MDINALLQMLQQRFGQGGGQQAFAGGSPGFMEGVGPHMTQPGQMMTNPTQRQPAQTSMQSPLGSQMSGGGGNIMQSIMQMLQGGKKQGMGGGTSHQMNLG